MICFLVSVSVPVDTWFLSRLVARRAGACSPGHSRSAAVRRQPHQPTNAPAQLRIACETDPVDDPVDDVDWERLYGPWQPFTPAEVKALLEGFPRPWWLIGGHAIGAFTGVRRPHEDVDLSIFGRDVPFLRRQVEGRYHLWSNHGGTLRPI